MFADIVNVLLFSGKQVVAEDELEEENPNSSYKADNKLHAQERDVAKIGCCHQTRPRTVAANVSDDKGYPF